MHKLRYSLVAATIAASFGTVSAAFAADYQVTVTNITNGIYFTPVIAAAHDPSARMFELATEASPQLQAIAEGGDISGMSALLESIGASVGAGDGLLAPGASVTLNLTDAAAGSVLSLSSMLLPTNDGFVGIDSASLPTGGDSVTLFARSYDAGTEANDELVGSGAPGEAGFPAPPPVVASGTGTGGTGVNALVEGLVHIHRGVLGDLDPTGGVSDINAAVHHWQDPVARVVIQQIGGDTGGGDTGGGDASVTAVDNLTGAVYSSSAVEVFWGPATSDDARVVSYRVLRDGEPVANSGAFSLFEEGLDAGTTYEYSVTAIDANGAEGPASTIELTTNAR